MQGEILRYFRDFTWTVRPPRELQERAIRIEREREQLTNDLGRNPTARELAAQVGCTAEELLDASEAAHARASGSFDRPATTQEGDAATLAERLGDEDPGFAAVETSATLDRLLDTLSERDQLVLRLRFREDLTQAEIGRRIGCSQMHVSRIQRAALAQLVQNATTTPREPNVVLRTTPAECEALWV
jgi:RNA polymerase sigma-B factor